MRDNKAEDEDRVLSIRLETVHSRMYRTPTGTPTRHEQWRTTTNSPCGGSANLQEILNNREQRRTRSMPLKIMVSPVRIRASPLEKYLQNTGNGEGLGTVPGPLDSYVTGYGWDRASSMAELVCIRERQRLHRRSAGAERPIMSNPQRRITIVVR
jgi:hypothetical protein